MQFWPLLAYPPDRLHGGFGAAKIPAQCAAVVPILAAGGRRRRPPAALRTQFVHLTPENLKKKGKKKEGYNYFGVQLLGNYVS